MRILLILLLLPIEAICRSENVYGTEVRCIGSAWETLELLGDTPCPGWSTTPFAVLLVTDSVEYLFGHPYPSDEFVADHSFEGLGRVVSRPRVFPLNLLATMPAVNGLPTVVIGTLANTGLSTGEWTSTLLHEHFHQIQFSRPGYYAGVNALDLAHGDETGMWMLNYAFNYSDSSVVRAFDRYRGLLRAVCEEGIPLNGQREADITAARQELVAVLTPEDVRYMDLQLWQEGTARYMEQHVLELLVEKGVTWKEIGSDTQRMAQAIGTSTLDELTRTQLAHDQRICFYAVGWAEARSAASRGGNFWGPYFARPFQTATFFDH